ncbi:hypothetical protein EVAR_54660_1 [Eumeta japonica]|uniref:Uncharacterized protein n=1 Tax=Eumeta variegata TaxID=151549 RepID=A0A4C1XAC2_EUMVA|nr:hypothetical protein EVAR_54660_1 [Eumeta japonica]
MAYLPEKRAKKIMVKRSKLTTYSRVILWYAEFKRRRTSTIEYPRSGRTTMTVAEEMGDDDDDDSKAANPEPFGIRKSISCTRLIILQTAVRR